MSGSRKPVLVVLLVLSISLGWVAIHYPLADWLVSYAGWARANPLYSVPLFVLVFVIVTVLMAPGWILTVLGGYLYGWLAGTAIVSVASLAGAVAAFLAGRILMRDWVLARARKFPRFNALYKAIQHRGFEVIFLTRVSAVFPYNLLNYLYGLTHVDLGRYALATWLGMIPVITLYVFVGATADDFVALARGEAQTGNAGIAISVLAVFAMLLVLVILTRTAARILDEDLAEEESGSN